MKSIQTKNREQGQLFKTDRLIVINWNALEKSTLDKQRLLENVLKIMTPNVTKDLPDGWQNLLTFEDAKNWVNQRIEDSWFYAIQFRETKDIIGFLFLNTDNEINNSYELRLGYLLSESSWGKAIGSELINGLVVWCKKEENIVSISGGVAKNNIGSIRVLEKNGFAKARDKLPGETLLYKLEIK